MAYSIRDFVIGRTDFGRFYIRLCSEDPLFGCVGYMDEKGRLQACVSFFELEKGQLEILEFCTRNGMPPAEMSKGLDYFATWAKEKGISKANWDTNEGLAAYFCALHKDIRQLDSGKIFDEQPLVSMEWDIR